MSGEAFVGLDLGTSGMKGAVVSVGGELLATAQAAYPSQRPRGGRSEQDPADWWEAIRDVVGALAERVASREWSGIGLTGMIPTLVLADDEGAAIGPAITWEDDRAEEEGDRYRSEAGADHLYRETGQWVDGRYLLPMFRWIAHQEPARAARARRLLSAKDHVFQLMTGETRTDPSTATGFGCFGLAAGTWIPELAGDDVLPLLPEVRPSAHRAALSPARAGELLLPNGLPVYLGAADSVAGVLGVGAVAPGERASLWGTSTVILGVSLELAVDPGHRYLVTPLALGDGWGLEMDLVSTGRTIGWAAELLGLDGDARLFELAERSAPGAGGLTFLPFLGYGEQGALWDASLRGTLSGLTLLHGPADIARALLEGLAREFRRCVDVLDEAGTPSPEVAVAGGAVGSSYFAAALADASQVTVVRSSAGQWASARGAALIAGAAAGAMDAQDLPKPGGEAFAPNPDARPMWDALAARHDALLAAVRSGDERVPAG